MPLSHIAAISNAVLVAIMPQPIPLSSVIDFRQAPRKDSLMCSVMVTNESNRFMFSYANGCVKDFKINHIPFLDDDPAQNWPSYAFGKDNMTTNAANDMARDSINKLGLDPKDFHADLPPTVFEGSIDLKDGNHVPFAKILWQSPPAKNLEEQQQGYFLEFIINMNKKTLIGTSILTRKIWGEEPKIQEPQIQGKWYVTNNAPMHPN